MIGVTSDKIGTGEPPLPALRAACVAAVLRLPVRLAIALDPKDRTCARGEILSTHWHRTGGNALRFLLSQAGVPRADCARLRPHEVSGEERRRETLARIEGVADGRHGLRKTRRFAVKAAAAAAEAAAAAAAAAVARGCLGTGMSDRDE